MILFVLFPPLRHCRYLKLLHHLLLLFGILKVVEVVEMQVVLDNIGKVHQVQVSIEAEVEEVHFYLHFRYKRCWKQR